MKDSAYYRDLAAKCLMPNYGDRATVLVRGEGVRVWDADGREYLDFLSGVSVVNLGHCHPAVSDALAAQAHQLMHCSNHYVIPQQVELAAKLCEVSFGERCFFSNSGAEANEGAIKLARLYSLKKHGPGRHEIITMLNSFHGRTMATITATGQEKVQKGFEPLLEGFRYAKLNDLESVFAQITDATCAIMVEPAQGEGGVNIAEDEFLRALRSECDRRDILLIFDEVQSAMGRCGALFAYELCGVAPDIMTLAKALGNGMPIGAMLASAKVAEVLGPGTHGSTFGGNPLACAAGLAVLKVMIEEQIPARAERMGAHFRKRLAEVLAGLDTVKEIRGRGLMIGVELTHPGAQVVKKCAARGVLINCPIGNVIRMMPPLVVTESECDRVAEIFAEVLKEERERVAAESKPQP